MAYVHSPDGDTYIESRGKIILNACPGSGKTTTIAFKISELLKTWDKENGCRCGIACLSFTNVAKNEIDNKILEFSNFPLKYPHIVSTIDSFINQYITLPFFQIFNPYFKDRPTIVENASFIDDWFFNKYRLSNNQPIQYSYPASKIDILLDDSFVCDNKGNQLQGKDSETFSNYCNEIKNRQFGNGVLKNSDSTFVALQILRKKPEIAKTLIARFPYIIVDEAQDTSDIQDAIFQELIKAGLENIEYVGDPYQSLYEWRNAKPSLFWEKFKSSDWTKCQLCNCRRSNKNIIKCYSLLRCANEAEITSENEAITIPVQFLKFNNHENLITKYFELSHDYASDRNIVVRGKSQLKDFNAKSGDDSYWKIDPCVPLLLIKAKNLFDNSSIRDAVNLIRKCVFILFDKTANENLKNRNEIEKKIFSNPLINSKIVSLLTNLPSFDLPLSVWTTQCQTKCKEVFGLENEPDFQMKKGRFSSKHKELMSSLFVPAKNIGLVNTIHSVKGKTYDSLMLVLNKNSSGQSISYSDLCRPIDLPSEKQRMIYVAMSRPRHQLIVAIPQSDEITEAEIKEKFGDAVIFDEID